MPSRNTLPQRIPPRSSPDSQRQRPLARGRRRASGWQTQHARICTVGILTSALALSHSSHHGGLRVPPRSEVGRAHVRMVRSDKQVYRTRVEVASLG